MGESEEEICLEIATSLETKKEQNMKKKKLLLFFLIGMNKRNL